MSALSAAIRLLTIIPAGTGEWNARAFTRSVLFFPVVGLAIGGSSALVNWLARLAMPDLPAAALALAAGAALTGALHLDGLADTFDGLFGGHDPQRRLEIMRDPAIGVYGVAAVTLALLIKWGAISSLPDAHGWAAIAVSAMAGRGAAVASISSYRYLRTAGLGTPYRAASRPINVAAAVFAFGAGFVIAGPYGLAIVGGSALAGLGFSAFASHRLGGGVTGDVYGASIELGESFALIAFAGMFGAGLAVGPLWGS